MKRFVNRITAIVLAAVLLLPMLTVTGTITVGFPPYGKGEWR